MALGRLRKKNGEQEPSFDVRGVSLELQQNSEKEERFPQELVAPHEARFFAVLNAEENKNPEKLPDYLNLALSLSLIFPERRQELHVDFDQLWEKCQEKIFSLNLLTATEDVRDNAIGMLFVLYLFDPNKCQQLVNIWTPESIKQILAAKKEGFDDAEVRLLFKKILGEQITPQELAEGLKETLAKFTEGEGHNFLFSDTIISMIVYPDFLALLKSNKDKFKLLRKTTQQDLEKYLLQYLNEHTGILINQACFLKLLCSPGIKIGPQGLSLSTETPVDFHTDSFVPQPLEKNI